MELGSRGRGKSSITNGMLRVNMIMKGRRRNKMIQAPGIKIMKHIDGKET